MGPCEAIPSRSNRLLVIDDDPFVPRWIRQVAEREGYDVTVSADPQAVRTICRSLQPTLVLIDLTLGGYQGLDVLRLLAAEQCAAPIVLTGAAELPVLQSAARFGESLDLAMAGTLAKPIDLGHLRRTLATHAQTAEQPGPDRAASDQPTPIDGRLAADNAARWAGHPDEPGLRAAFSRNELRVFYQPQISLRTGRVVGVEALVRWQHPTRGLITPHSFLPVAEHADLMRPLTLFVLAQAIEQSRRWAAAGQPVSIAVNLFPALLRDPLLPDEIARLVERARIAPELLTLELAESATIGHAQEVIDGLMRLRLKGCRLSLDNFGAGFSSLIELRHMPFSQLKIDRSFILEARTRRAARAIVDAVIEFGHKLGLEIVGEGVEDRETLALLREAGCDLAQGFLISRPVDEETMAEVLVANAASGTEGRRYMTRAGSASSTPH